MSRKNKHKVVKVAERKFELFIVIIYRHLELVTKSTVAYWRANGNLIPKQDVLLKMAEYFNVSVDYLLGNNDIKNPPKSSISDDDIKFALWGDVADEIPNDKLQEVKTFAEFIKNTYKKDNNK